MTSPYFRNYSSEPEQNLVEDLIHEAVSIMGFDGYYIPNTNEASRDLLYGDDPLKVFTDSYSIELYLSNSVDAGVNNDFFTKFGLEIKNNTRVQLPRRAFSAVPYSRPREGDLIYIPFLSGTGELYEIKYVNDATDFFTLGRKQPYSWELEIELFKYSHDKIDTGLDEIDFVNEFDAYAIEYTLGSGNDIDYTIREIVYQGNTYANAICTATLQEWNSPNNTIKLTNISGTFVSNSNIIGNSSGASYIMVDYDEFSNPQIREVWDNKVVEDEVFNIIDTSETNPFGTL
jgi:hypothetical protein